MRARDWKSSLVTEEEAKQFVESKGLLETVVDVPSDSIGEIEDYEDESSFIKLHRAPIMSPFFKNFTPSLEDKENRVVSNSKKNLKN